MSPEMRAKLAALGTELTPTAAADDDHELMASIAAPRDEDVAITRDHQYGPDARNRLDILRKGIPRSAPVLVYVHGGGFVMGDKTSAGSPFYDNIGQWAAQQGYIGVTMTYRLAPAHHWPCGPEDMALAVRWLRANIAAHGGDPEKIFLLGQSAGAVHVAAYIAHAQFHDAGGTGHRRRADDLGHLRPDDAAAQPVQPGLLRRCPRQRWPKRAAPPACWPRQCRCCSASANWIRRISRTRPRSWPRHGIAAKGVYPPMEYMAGHNHLSPAQCIGSSEDDLGPRIARFIAIASARGLRSSRSVRLASA